MDAQTNHVLLVSIHHMLYPITAEVLHQIFDPYGFVEDIALIQRPVNFQALIQFQNLVSATSALKTLHGRYIYEGCCRLDIQAFIKLQDTKLQREEHVVLESEVSEVDPSTASEELQLVSASKKPNLIVEDEPMNNILVDVVDAEEIGLRLDISDLVFNESKVEVVDSVMDSPVFHQNDRLNYCTSHVRRNANELIVCSFSTGKPPPLPPDLDLICPSRSKVTMSYYLRVKWPNEFTNATESSGYLDFLVYVLHQVILKFEVEEVLIAAEQK